MDRIDRILDQWKQERPDLDVSSMGPIGRIKSLFHHLERAMTETLAEHGLNLSGFDVLATLRRTGEPYALTPGDLIASTMVTSGTITHRVDQLVADGFVERVRSPEDGRSVRVTLTDEGFDVIEAAVTDHVETQARLTSGLSESELRRLDRLLAKFLGSLEDTDA